MASEPARRAGGGFREVALRSEAEVARDARRRAYNGEDAQPPPPLHDSILTLPELASPEECSQLVGAADAWCESSEWSGVALRRIECHPDGVNLNGRAHALSHVLLSRALWAVESLMPDLAGNLFPDACGLLDLSFKFSGEEPMLNRYTVGGDFAPHQDGHALTVLMPLSTADGEFEGGGTAFWSPETIGPDSASAKGVPPSLVLRPPAGTGILWRGHLTHAGLPVTRGVRHVWVASFDLRIARQRG